MLNLLAAYSLQEIVIFIVLLCVAFKEVVAFFKWLKELYNDKFNNDVNKMTKEQTLEQHYEIYTKQHEETIEKCNILDKKIDDLIDMFNNRFKSIEEKIDVLTASDKDDIKSWLVEKYNFYKENSSRPISYHTMETIEKRYSHYKEEGGNSFIDETIMPGLRMMAKEENRCV